MTVDEKKLGEFMGRFVGDLGAVLHAPLIVLGDKLGLYRQLAKGPATPAELARATRTSERYVAEWLAANAASGYVEYDAAAKRYRMTEEQAFTLADPDSPAYIPGAFLIAMSMFKDEPKVTEIFRTGQGLGWHEHDKCLFEGTEKFFRPSYAGNLVASWIPALEGIREKLEAGGRVADVGCGHGASTILMAKAFPRATFHAYDYHAESIVAAKRAAESAGVADRITFEVASAKTFPGRGYDLVTFFDCLHDMGDPEGAARHVRSTLAPEGSWMIVEPFAHDDLEKNLNPVGRIFYSASTMICTPASKSQEVGLALGAQAGEGRLREVVQAAGFKRFRRATETPFNLVLEAKP
ncbi:MAG: class I SAM-dependent methyltransferase [Polyangiaceae bacterium]|jgi:SAM-dependent methyltransferase